MLFLDRNDAVPYLSAMRRYLLLLLVVLVAVGGCSRCNRDEPKPICTDGDIVISDCENYICIKPEQLDQFLEVVMAAYDNKFYQSMDKTDIL